MNFLKKRTVGLALGLGAMLFALGAFASPAIAGEPVDATSVSSMRIANTEPPTTTTTTTTTKHVTTTTTTGATALS